MREGAITCRLDTPYSDFVISEKVAEYTKRTEWAQGLNPEAFQTEGQLGQTECCQCHAMILPDTPGIQQTATG